jgi:hypothetical protein
MIVIHTRKRVTGCQSREELGRCVKKMLLAEKGRTSYQKAGQSSEYIDG